MLQMKKYRQRTYYSEADKTMMWDRWSKGESLGDAQLIRVTFGPFTRMQRPFSERRAVTVVLTV